MCVGVCARTARPEARARGGAQVGAVREEARACHLRALALNALGRDAARDAAARDALSALRRARDAPRVPPAPVAAIVHASPAALRAVAAGA